MGRLHLITTAVSVQKCQRCAATVFAGWSEGFLVRVDPTPLSRAGADAAAEEGRAVYILAHRELTYRDSEHIFLPGLLLPEHACGLGVPESWRTRLPTFTVTDAGGYSCRDVHRP